MRTQAKSATSDFRILLQQNLVARCKNNSSYSLRAFARQLGVNPSFLSKILSKKRVITPALVQRLSPKLGLSPREMGRYLSGRTLKDPYHTLNEDQFAVISDWYHYAILELIGIQGFDDSPEWISNRLGIRRSEAKAAIDRLLRLEILERSNEGKLQNTKGSFTTTGNPFTTTAFRRLQKQILRQGIQAMESIPIEERDQSSMTVAIDVGRIPEAKEKIKTFRRELARFLQSSGAPMTEVYQLSVSFFPVTKKIMLSLFIPFLLVSSAWAQGGGSGQEGHGGGSVVCYTDSTKTKVRSIEVYDLYEGQHVFGLPAPHFGQKNFNQILSKVFHRARKVDPKIGAALKKEVAYVLGHLSPKESIAEAKDAHVFIHQPNCEYQALAYWASESGKFTIPTEIQVSLALYQQLTPVQRAAFIVHEALYLMYHHWQQSRTSDQIRYLTAQLLLNHRASEAYWFIQSTNDSLFDKHDYSFRQGLLCPMVEQADEPWFSTSTLLVHSLGGLATATYKLISDQPVWVDLPDGKSLKLNPDESFNVALKQDLNQSKFETKSFFFHADTPYSLLIRSNLSGDVVVFHLGDAAQFKKIRNKPTRVDATYKYGFYHDLEVIF